MSRPTDPFATFARVAGWVVLGSLGLLALMVFSAWFLIWRSL